MNTISLKNIDYHLPNGRKLLNKININFGASKYGLIGRNRICKSSLLQLIAGEIQASVDEIEVLGKIVYCAQRPDCDKNCNVAKNKFQGALIVVSHDQDFLRNIGIKKEINLLHFCK